MLLLLEVNAVAAAAVVWSLVGNQQPSGGGHVVEGVAGVLQQSLRCVKGRYSPVLQQQDSEDRFEARS